MMILAITEEVRKICYLILLLAGAGARGAGGPDNGFLERIERITDPKRWSGID